MLKDIVWRQMAASDLDMVAEIAAEVHPDFFEEPAVFAERLALYPAGCQFLETGGEPGGYVFSHPWRFKSLPALNSLLGAIPAGADTYYLHDLALLPGARGTGAARDVVEHLIAHADTAGFPSMSLVAVNGSAAFWQRHGFVATDVPELSEKLASYEQAARFMVRTR